MLSQETLELYRKMSVSERLDLTFQMMRHDWPYMFAGSPEVVARRFELVNRENDARNRNILEALARTRET